jgi:hypothetical protein
MLFLRQEHLLPKLSQKSRVNCNVSGTVLLKHSCKHLLSFGAKPVVFQVAIQKLEDQDI